MSTQMPKHFTPDGFYRPEQYMGPWAILPDRLAAYLSVVNSCDLGALAASAAAKRELSAATAIIIQATSPSEPLPTEKPDAGEGESEEGVDIEKEKVDRKAELESEIADKEKKLADSEKDIADQGKELQDRKEKKAADDEEAIKKSEQELAEKKSACDKLKTEIEECYKQLESTDEEDELEPEDGTDEEKEPVEKKDGEPESSTPILAETLPAADGGPVVSPTPAPSATFEGYELHGDTAIIDMAGPITKHPTSFQDLMGGASTVRTQRAIRAANVDPAVQRVCLRIESPGGTVSGVLELMQDVKSSAKPVWAYAEDTCASAAYFVACNAGFIACNPTAMVGSVGTLVVLQDTSGKYAKDGIRVHVLGTGKWKGAGMDGSEITEEQVAYFQNIVEGVNALFTPAVASARKLSAESLNTISEAGVFIGQKAVDAGLVDAVMSFEQFLAKFEIETGAQVMEQQALVAEYQRGHAEARTQFSAMLAACDNDAGLAARLFSEGRTVSDAKEARMAAVKAELALLKSTGVSADDGQQKPVALGPGGSSDTVENEFMAKVKAYQAEHKCPARDALSAITSKFPQLYEEYKATFTKIEAVAPQESPAPPTK